MWNVFESPKTKSADRVVAEFAELAGRMEMSVAGCRFELTTSGLGDHSQGSSILLVVSISK
jgi:hypothetical protein